MPSKKVAFHMNHSWWTAIKIVWLLSFWQTMYKFQNDNASYFRPFGFDLNNCCSAYSFRAAAMFQRNFHGKLNMQIRIVGGNIKCMEIVFWPSNFFFCSGPSSGESEKSPVSIKQFFFPLWVWVIMLFFSSLDWLTISSFKLFDAQMNDRSARFGWTNRSTNVTEPQQRMWKQSLTI